MFKQLSIVFFLALFLLSLAAIAGDFQTARVHKVTPQDEQRFYQKLQEVIEYTPADVSNRQGAIEIGRTWYDYAANTTIGRQMNYALTSTDGQDGIHFTFMKILPQGAERYVTYDYFDLNLKFFFGNQSVDESLGRSGWGKVINGKSDEAIITFHSNTLGGTHVYTDVSEAGYTFTSVYDTITTAGSVFPGIARNRDNVIFMSHDGSDWITGPIVKRSFDYMQTWHNANFPAQDPLTTDVGASEIWPTINPGIPDEFSFMLAPDITATAPNGSEVRYKTTDFGNTYTSTQILSDDDVFLINGNHTQYIVENFSQGWGIYTQDGTYHVAYGAVQGIIDTLNSGLIDLFPILYWNDRDQQWIEVTSDAADTPHDTTTINGLADFRPGNGLGNAYPILSEGPNGDLVCLWQQWEDDGTGRLVTVIPSGGNEIFVTDIWGAYSPDGGQHWSEPFWVAGTPGESDVYPNIPENFLWNATGDSIILDIMYMWDTIAGTSLFAGGNDPSECVWLYERVAIDTSQLVITGINDVKANVVDRFTLEQNYPNPFNPSTTIKYNLQKRANVTLEVFNSLGQKVATLVDGAVAAGSHDVEFSAAALSSGIYFYKLTAGNFSQTKKMLVMK